MMIKKLVSVFLISCLAVMPSFAEISDDVYEAESVYESEDVQLFAAESAQEPVGGYVVNENFDYATPEEMLDESTGIGMFPMINPYIDDKYGSTVITFEDGIMSMKQNNPNGTSSVTNGVVLPIPNKEGDTTTQTVEFKIKRNSKTAFWQCMFYGYNAVGAKREFGILDMNKNGLGWKGTNGAWGGAGAGSITKLDGKDSRNIINIINEWIVVKMDFDFKNQVITLYINGEKQSKAPVFYSGAGVVKMSNFCILKQTGSTHGTISQVDYFRMWNNERELLKQELDAISVSELTDEHLSEITSDLKQPLISQGSPYGGNITWKSNKPEVISNDGIVTRQENDESVILTATDELGSVKVARSFYFNVKGNNSADFDPTGYYLVYENDFSSGEADTSWALRATGNSKTAVEDGKIAAVKESQSNTVSAKLNILGAEDIYGVSGKVYVFADVGAENIADMEMSLLDSSSKTIAKISFDKLGCFAAAGTYLSGGTEQYSGSYPYPNGDYVKVRFEADPVAGSFKLRINNIPVTIDGDDMLPNINQTTNIQSVLFRINSGTEYPAKMTVDNVKVYIPDEKRMEMAKNRVVFDAIRMANSKESHITGDLNLFTDKYLGTDISWESDKPNIISADGKVNRPTDAAADVTLTAVISMGEQKENVVFNLKVMKDDPYNYAFERKVTSNLSAQQGSSINYINDGDTETKYITVAAGKSMNILVDMDGMYNINRLIIPGGLDTITGYKIEVSENNSEYTEVASGEKLEKTTAFKLVKAKYLRLTVEKESGVSVEIPELEIRTEFTDEEAVDADLEAFAPNLPKSTTENITLPTEGQYGSTITWTSSKPDVISPAGIVNRGSETVTVILTAEIRKGSIAKTKTYQVSVTGKQTSSSGGGGGGGGKSSAKSSSYIPVISVENPPAEEVIFSDLAGAEWAEEYIIALYNKGAVNGYGNKTFAPFNNVTREEFVKILITAFDIAPQTAEISFGDCEKGMWYADYIETGVKAGIVNGMSDSRFGIGEHITREDIITLTARALEYKGIANTGADIAPPDMADVSAYAQNAVRMLMGYDIVNGDTNGKINPKSFATRAETAKIIGKAAALIK